MQIRVFCVAVCQGFDDALAADTTTGLGKPASTRMARSSGSRSCTPSLTCRASPAHGSSGTTPSRFMFPIARAGPLKPGTALAAVMALAGLSRVTRCTNSGLWPGRQLWLAS